MLKLLVALCAGLLAGCATVPVKSGPPLEVVEVIAVQGRTAEQLCNGARDWTAKTFRSSKAVVEVFDPQRGKLIGKGSMQLPIIWGATIPVHFTMTVDCKDGRLRASFDDYATEYQGMRNTLIEDERYKLQTNATERTRALIASLRQHLISGSSGDF